MAGAPQFINNPAGAYGYDVTGQNRGHQVVRKFRNMSSGTVIPKGAAVNLATVSTDGTGVLLHDTVSTHGNALFIGISLTSASTDQSTRLSSNAATSAWCDVCIEGVVENVLMSTAVLPGDILIPGSSLVAGMLVAAPPSSGASTGYFTVAGVALSSGSTQSTSGSTVGFGTSARGRAYIRPQFTILSSA